MNWLSLLSGLKSPLIIGAVCLAIGAAGGWKARALIAEADDAERHVAWARGVQLINAANEAQAAIKAADAKRALEAVEAAAQAERDRADALAAQLGAIRAIPDVENCALGLETMKILEGLM